jgi:hypothetical protein
MIGISAPVQAIQIGVLRGLRTAASGRLARVWQRPSRSTVPAIVENVVAADGGDYLQGKAAVKAAI